ncbi:HAD superfamily hydrolase (TIGR01509 family) [Streptomyces sp. CG 926]|uniref:HAD family hydrolase n=1 Tax=Streptomyces sp. CG 926 TaxID=1882405 RepID=UPI000D6D8314|nr:HAD family phosphatase [Streptomyces sp. CG 926]PWK69453.1 HAD superfamily hydrolase (TIGR01509 family) [Streptomyces sp. CG 926]
MNKQQVAGAAPGRWSGPAEWTTFPTAADGGTVWRGPAPSAVVFDCDGLLADSEPLWAAARAELYRRRGLAFGDVEREALLGLDVPDVAAMMAGHFTETGRERFIERELLDAGMRRIRSGVRPMVGALRCVARIAELMPVAVASNAPRRVLDLTLEAIGLGGRFAVTVAADEVGASKPAPDIYLAACRDLEVPPGSVLAFEDSAVGVRAAKAAGIPVVVVGGTCPLADLAWESLLDLRLDRWLTCWRAGGSEVLPEPPV